MTDTTTGKRHIIGPGRRRKLTYGQYSERDQALDLKSHALPPRDLFAGQSDVLATYDKVTTLIAAEAEQSRLAASKRAEAEAADTKHDDAVRNALTAGKDPKVKDTAEQLRAEADKADEYADLAHGQLVRALRELGAQIKPVTVDLFAPAEADLTAAGERIATLLDDLADEWQRWADAWQNRRWLSTAAHFGGASHWSPGRVPTTVTESIAAMRTAVESDLPTLTGDEGALVDWRIEQAAAAASTLRSAHARASESVA